MGTDDHQKYCYLCEDSLEGIFSAIYRAYEDRHGHKANEIRIRETGFNQELFCEYISVETDFDRALKVARTVQRDISRPAYELIQRFVHPVFRRRQMPSTVLSNTDLLPESGSWSV